MMKLCVLLVISLVASIDAEGIKEFSKKCPKAVGKYPFDDGKFAGKWYFIAGTPSDNEVTPTCFVYDFAPGSDSSTSISKISYIENNKTVTDEAYWSQVKWWPSISYVVLKKHDGNYGEVYKESVLTTDYESYGILLGCRPIFEPESKLFGRSLYVDIISRTPTLDRTILDTLKTFISGYDVDVSKFIDKDNSNCNF